RWMSVNAGLPCLSGMLRYFRTLAKTLDNFRPDIVWASSDVLHAAVAWAFCRPREIPYVVDLYDNYESFGLTKIPGMALLLRVGCRGAAGLTVISHGLDQWIASAYKTTAPRRVIGNAVPKDLFYPRDRSESRKILGLPAQARLIGTAGAIKRGRGIEVLFKAFLQLAQNDPDCWLAFAGPRDDSPARYPHARIIDLGILEPERVPWMISALDVAVICNVDSDFGRFCFPQKFYEMIACDVPVVAAEVGELKTLLSDWPDCLYPVDSVEGLAKKIRGQLDHPVRPRTIAVRTWDHEAAQLEAFFDELVHSHRS
ncbi:MAG: glycosyltransferase family 4 protein, partial [Methylococcales bacterium]